MQVTDDAIRVAIATLLEKRRPSATICPSEAARLLSPVEWRRLMSQVRAVAIAMASDGAIEIHQGGHAVACEQPLRGPIRLRRSAAAAPEHPITPDGRYFIVRGRLWRRTNPHLPEDVRVALVTQLMQARRALRGVTDDALRDAARQEVDRVKQALGERGPVWWTDGAPDLNRRLVKNTPYDHWFLGRARKREAD